MNLLFVEDEDDLRIIIQDYLELKGLNVVSFDNGLDAYHSLEEHQYDLALLDINVPKMDGFTLCKKIKENSNTPVIFITARVLEDDQLLGYELGCDEYIIKPVSLSVLYAKCKAVLKRNQKSDTLKINDITLDTKSHQVYLNNALIPVKDLDYRLLYYLMSNPDQILSREKILTHVWGYDYDGYDRSVDNHIKSLRKQLGNKGDCIQSIYGQGYMFNSKGVKS